MRVLGSIVLSALVLKEGVSSSLEYTGISIMIVSVSIYLVRSQRWMEQREQHAVQQNDDGLSIDGDRLDSSSGIRIL